MTLSYANKITILRILTIAPFVICMLKVNDPSIGMAMRYVSLLLLVLMGFSDAYDGYVARKKKEVTRLGSFLDPMADKLLVASACLLLTLKSTAVTGFRLPPTVAVLIIGKDFFLLLGFMILYFMTFQVKIIPAYIGKIATVLQITMIGGILIAPDVSKIFEGWIWFLRFVWWSAAATAVVATLIYIHAGTRYIEQFDNK
ncbi:MAG: CDP-diacylglycerol--glycerol-3-phosphate 3-phosphatidyltransferase [Planctomycetes bacterium ADurb.Bin401]|nr:MAG: CDP-diacylglycerol--glycerol-3-phosphate 3-phosphatidyltransferase [Planctomycetes bacterium ADurb.Bin401]